MSVLTSIANKIAAIGSGVDCSWECSHVDRVLVVALINLLFVSMLTLIANEITPSESGVDSSLHCSHVDRVLVNIHSRWVVSGLIQFQTKF